VAGVAAFGDHLSYLPFSGSVLEQLTMSSTGRVNGDCREGSRDRGANLTAPMSAEDGRPLTIEELERWVAFGARWRPVQIGDDEAIVELCECTGEVVEQRATRDARTIAYVRDNAPGPD
jgi:hypothetical protein